jgi:hypothetical protein
MSEDLALQKGVSQLQATSADLFTFAINTIILEATLSFV